MLELLLTVIVGVMTCVCLITLIRLLKLRKWFRYVPAASHIRDAELPTVSVCIPARNEMHAMTECLERLLASDYPKLEVIVLDDSSVDDTSMLIKSFAHAGVRFVEGSPLPSGWVGKNHALQGLLEEASGRFVLFLDVDTTLKTSSIRSLVEYAVSRNLPLISVMPKREDGLRASVFLGTLRYFWLLMTGTKKLPAVSGAAWLVDRATLLASGGFTPYKSIARPEVYVAAAVSAPGSTTLVIDSSQLGVSYEKKWQSQVETSIRLLTPQFGGSVRTGAIGLFLLAMIIVPLAAIILGIYTSSFALLVCCAVYLLSMTLLSLVYFKIAWKYGWWLGALHWPYVLAQEAILMFVSSVKYTRGSVTWKGRPIRTTTSLPASPSVE